MKPTAKARKPALKRRLVGAHVRPIPASQLSDEEFRRQIHLELADEIAAAQASFAKTHGHLLRPPTPAEIKTRAEKWRAFLEEERQNPVCHEVSEGYDRMLARMAAERAG